MTGVVLPASEIKTRFCPPGPTSNISTSSGMVWLSPLIDGDFLDGPPKTGDEDQRRIRPRGALSSPPVGVDGSGTVIAPVLQNVLPLTVVWLLTV